MVMGLQIDISAVPTRPETQRVGLPVKTYKSLPSPKSDTERSISPEGSSSRSSFSSIRERPSTLTQTFTSTSISSYLPELDESAVDESHSKPQHTLTDMTTVQFQSSMRRPASKMAGYWTPVNSFKGWKQINVGGRIASKSYGDLKVLSTSWSPESTPRPQQGVCPLEKSLLERLPTELLGAIITLLVLDVPPNGTARRNVDLMSLLQTSRTIHSATLKSLYQNVTIPHSRIFQKFLAHITAHPALGTIVRRLDFCHFNPAQLFSTAAERSQARNLTSESLRACLELTPYLQEFLAQEYIDEDLDIDVLRILLLRLPRLQALDFCGCTKPLFRDSLAAVAESDLSSGLSICRLSLHKCITLSSSTLQAILSRLPRLTHLDVAGTRITDGGLASIPASAQLTHLNLAKCTLLSAGGVIDFFQDHPAVVASLQFLSLATDARSHQLLGPEDLDELLPMLPKTLKSLSLKGNKMRSHHINALRPLTKHLEELGIGRSLTLRDIDRIFVPDEDLDPDQQINWVQPSLKYIDISDLWGNELDLGFLFGRQCAILPKYSEPLEVVEIEDKLSNRALRNNPGRLQRAGWRISEAGSRVWLVRVPSAENGLRGCDGRRPWKMGAESWGMRKIPVARAEVGGMYGFFMFGKKL